MPELYHHIRFKKFVNITSKVFKKLFFCLFCHANGQSLQLTAVLCKRNFIRLNLVPRAAFLLACYISGSFTAVVYAESSAHEIRFHEVEQGVYVHYGRHELLTADTVAGIANHGFIVGESSVAIIDPGGTVDSVRQTITAIKKLTSLPISHVVVSHVHPDHSLGLAAFASEQHFGKPVILGHPKLADALERNLQFFRQHFIFDNTTEQLRKLIEDGDIQPVDTERIVDLGNRKITLTPYTRAHSDTDVSVYDHATKTLWAGDLLFVERTPAVGESILGWLKVLSQISQLDIGTVIPGHGHGGKFSELIQPQRSYLEFVVAQTRQAIARQVSLKEFISDESNFVADLRAQWKLFDEQHALNLARAYAELEWE